MPLIEYFDLDTTEGKQAQTLKFLQAVMTSSFRGLQGTGGAISKHVFRNQFGLTPQQVCDALGNQAGQVVALSHAVAALLNSIIPGSADLEIPNTPDGHAQTVTVNQDGTVTVTVIP